MLGWRLENSDPLERGFIDNLLRNLASSSRPEIDAEPADTRGRPETRLDVPWLSRDVVPYAMPG